MLNLVNEKLKYVWRYDEKIYIVLIVLLVESAKILIKAGINIYEKDLFNKTALVHISEKLKVYKEKSKKDSLIDIAYLIIREMSEDHIRLNKNINTPQDAKDIVNNYIKLLYSLQQMPIEIFEEISKKF